MHSYTVSLRIESPELEPEQVTRELGIQPTQTRAKGERRSETTVWEKALWEFEVFPEGGSKWDSLEAGLGALLKKFMPLSQIIEKYKKRHAVYIWCGVFGAGFSGGPQLSSELLKELSDFGIPLDLDIYSSKV
jgi:hypothetical protein